MRWHIHIRIQNWWSELPRWWWWQWRRRRGQRRHKSHYMFLQLYLLFIQLFIYFSVNRRRRRLFLWLRLMPQCMTIARLLHFVIRVCYTRVLLLQQSTSSLRHRGGLWELCVMLMHVSDENENWHGKRWEREREGKSKLFNWCDGIKYERGSLAKGNPSYTIYTHVCRHGYGHAIAQGASSSSFIKFRFQQTRLKFIDIRV